MLEIHTVSPLDLLKNPMILIAVVGLGFVFGMPYLMDNSMFTFLSALSLSFHYYYYYYYNNNNNDVVVDDNNEGDDDGDG